MRKTRVRIIIYMAAAILALIAPAYALAEAAGFTASPEDGAALDPGERAAFTITISEQWPDEANAWVPCTVRAELGEGLTLDIDAVELIRAQEAGEDIGLSQFIFGNDGFVQLADSLFAGDKIVFAATAGAGSGACYVTYRDERFGAEYEITVPPTAPPAAAAAAPTEIDTAAEPPEARDLSWLIWMAAGVLAAGCAAGAVLLIRRKGKQSRSGKGIKRSAVRAYLDAVNMAIDRSFKEK